MSVVARSGLLACALFWAGIASAGSTSGFRGDGTGRFAVASPPTSWGEASRAWSAALPSWSNASPVLLGSLVCTTAEPTWVVCVDQRTGAEVWRAENPYAATLSGGERAAFDAKLAALPTQREAFKVVRDAYSRVKRDLRARADDPSLLTELERLSADMTRLRTQIDELDQYDTPPSREIIGYASATPVVHEGALFVVFGNGVVSRFEADGRRAWSVWLGPAPKQMRGYHLGTSASPVMAGGTLVVGHGRLVGLDPKTGAVRWRGGEYTDFGTPGVGSAGGVAFLALPSGEIVRATDGVVLAKGLHDQWYAGPTVQGDVVTYVGGLGTVQIQQAGHAKASSWRVVPDGGGLRAEPLWKVELPATTAFYNHPVATGSSVVAVDNAAELWLLDGATGALRARWKPPVPIGASYSSPVLAGGLVFFEGEEGGAMVVSVEGEVRLVGQSRIGKLRSVPCFVGEAAFVRTLDALERYDRRAVR